MNGIVYYHYSSVSQVSQDPEDFLDRMVSLEKKVYRDQMDFLDPVVGKESKELKAQLDTGDQMVFLGRKVHMNDCIFSSV